MDNERRRSRHDNCNDGNIVYNAIPVIEWVVKDRAEATFTSHDSVCVIKFINDARGIDNVTVGEDCVEVEVNK
jgi:hypothetical protein